MGEAVAVVAGDVVMLGYPAGEWLSYTYPPTAALLFGPLASMPSSWAVLIVEAAGLVVFVTGLSSLSTRGARAAMLLSSIPVVCLNLRFGQAGLLTAGLAAHGARLWLAGRSGRAGVLIGLLTLKPHMALGLPVAALWARDRRFLVVFVTTAIGLVATSLAAFGTAPWSAYPGALAVVGANLASGALPLARLSSAYAAAYGLGLRGTSLWAFHFAALAVLTLVMSRHRGDRRVVASLSLAWDLFVSPYVYDYDLAMLAVVAALLSDSPIRRLGDHCCLNLLVGVIITQSVGMAWWIADGRGGVAFYGLALLLATIAVGFLTRLRALDVITQP